MQTHTLTLSHTISYITHAWMSMRIKCSHIQIQQQDLPHFQTLDLCQVIFQGSSLLNSSSKSSTYSHLDSTSTKLSYTKHMAYWKKYPPNKLWSKVCACVCVRGSMLTRGPMTTLYEATFRPLRGNESK